jgi:hypothetical protein
MDELASYAIVVVIRTGSDGVTRGVVGVPEHGDLPEFHERPSRCKRRSAQLIAGHIDTAMRKW